MRIFFLIIIFILPFNSAQAAAQGENIARMAQELDRLQARLDSVRVQMLALSAQVDSLAAVITAQKRRGSASFLEQRSLADNLQHSQDLAAKLQRTQEQEAGLEDSLRLTAGNVLEKVNAQIAELTRQAEASDADDSPAGDAVLKRDLEAALRLRARCQALTSTAPAVVQLRDVRIEPGEGQESLQQKSDVLLDQADRLRALAGQARVKVDDLRDELDMRQRLQDFVSDLRLFDPASEAVGDAPQAVGSAENLSAADRVNLSFGKSSSLPGSFLTQGVSWPTNIAELSEADLQQWIQRLQANEKQWAAQADSLHAVARQIQESIDKKP